MNETTRNLIQAIREYKEEPVKPVVLKLTYDKETGIAGDIITEDTDLPWIEITKEQYAAGMQYKKLRVVNGKIEEIKKNRLRNLPLIEGNKWFTSRVNMLIVGNERGWDERKDY